MLNNNIKSTNFNRFFVDFTVRTAPNLSVSINGGALAHSVLSWIVLKSS